MNKKQSLEYHRAWRKANPTKKYYKPEWHREYRLKKHYGISIGQYNDLFIEQKGRCAICSHHQSESKYKLAVDHNHESGKVRGLLCFTCNTRLSVLEETNWFETAQNYLRSHTDDIQK